MSVPAMNRRGRATLLLVAMSCGQWGVLGGVLGGVLCSVLGTGCRIVRIDDEQMARAAVQAGEAAELRDDQPAARAAYRRALGWCPRDLCAWHGLLRVGRTALRGEFEQWCERAPDDALPRYLLARLHRDAGEPSLALPWALAAWRVSGGDFAPLLETRVDGPRGRAEWWAYLDFLNRCEPRTQALELRSLWTRIELGMEAPGAEAPATGAPATGAPATSTPGGPAQRRLGDPNLGVEGQRIARAWLRLAAGDAQAANAQFDGVALHTWEERRLHIEVLQSLGHHGEAQRELAGARALAPHECDVLAARSAAASNDFDGARQLLRGALPRVHSPRLRTGGRLLEAHLQEHAGKPSAETLREALQWATGRPEVEAVRRSAIDRGDVGTAAAACQTYLNARFAGPRPGPELRDRWVREAETLEYLRESAHLLPDAWPFFRDANLAERRQALSLLPDESRRQALTWALGHPRPEFRILALRVLREDPRVPFEDVPGPLATDPDARVRVSWILLAVRQGGEIASQAVRAGRNDPDPYVREVAAGVTLP